ncbi:hypothetical protein, partial [Lonsdalea populi]|uniref:hypothetical protein n=1 Tax=Lonsdalea populi TaxID=1172565 RepID=UPI001C660DAD
SETLLPNQPVATLECGYPQYAGAMGDGRLSDVGDRRRFRSYLRFCLPTSSFPVLTAGLSSYPREAPVAWRNDVG